MRPEFELNQIRRYITYLQQYPSQLNGTVESHLFPVLQRIFFREGLEVRNDVTVHGRKFAFLLVDLDLRRPNVCVDFAYNSDLQSTESTIPEYAFEWGDRIARGEFGERLLFLRDHRLNPAFVEKLGSYRRSISFLDFDTLQEHATKVFESYISRQQQAAVVLVIDLLDNLIRGIGMEEIPLRDIHWLDIERMVHRIFERMGFHAHLTPSSKDGGRDVLACDIKVDDVHWYNIEIKHWAGKKVGTKVIAKTLETALREGRRGALVLSTSGVSEDALRVRTEVYEDYIRVGDAKKLVTSCRHLTQSKSGVWSPHSTLRSFLFADTV
jgi:hypothetical protein